MSLPEWLEARRDTIDTVKPSQLVMAFPEITEDEYWIACGEYIEMSILCMRAMKIRAKIKKDENG